MFFYRVEQERQHEAKHYTLMLMMQPHNFAGSEFEDELKKW